jgi:hypothetical protein
VWHEEDKLKVQLLLSIIKEITGMIIPLNCVSEDGYFFVKLRRFCKHLSRGR